MWYALVSLAPPVFDMLFNVSKSVALIKVNGLPGYVVSSSSIPINVVGVAENEVGPSSPTDNWFLVNSGFAKFLAKTLNSK